MHRLEKAFFGDTLLQLYSFFFFFFVFGFGFVLFRESAHAGKVAIPPSCQKHAGLTCLQGGFFSFVFFFFFDVWW